jgi:hypothetical protein
MCLLSEVTQSEDGSSGRRPAEALANNVVTLLARGASPDG